MSDYSFLDSLGKIDINTDIKAPEDTKEVTVILDNDIDNPENETVILPTEEDIAALENYMSQEDNPLKRYYQLNPSSFAKEQLRDPGLCNSPKEELIIRTTDNKNFRIYFKGSTFFSPSFLSKFCTFMLTRKPDESVTLYLGCRFSTLQAIPIGSLLSAIQMSQAKTIGIASGYCGIPETIIWLYCKYRDIQTYGTLSFGGYEIVKYVKQFDYYISIFLERAVEFKYITQEIADKLKETNGEYVLYYSNFYKD